MSAPAAAPANAAGSDAPAFYNAAVDLVERNLPARAGKTAFVDDFGAYSYGELAERVDRAAGALLALGLEPEQRVVLGLLDTIDFPAAFLGAIKAGVVPIPVNTLFPAADYAYILADSRAKAALVSAELLPQFEEAARLANWTGRIVVSDPRGAAAPGRAEPRAAADVYAGAHPRLDTLLAAAAPLREAAPTRPTTSASGSTRRARPASPRARCTSRPA